LLHFPALKKINSPKGCGFFGPLVVRHAAFHSLMQLLPLAIDAVATDCSIVTRFESLVVFVPEFTKIIVRFPNMM